MFYYICVPKMNRNIIGTLLLRQYSFFVSFLSDHHSPMYCLKNPLIFFLKQTSSLLLKSVSLFAEIASLCSGGAMLCGFAANIFGRSPKIILTEGQNASLRLSAEIRFLPSANMSRSSYLLSRLYKTTPIR